MNGSKWRCGMGVRPLSTGAGCARGDAPAGAAALPPALRPHFVDVLPVLGQHMRAAGDTDDSSVNLGQPAGGLQQTTARLAKVWAALQRLHKAGLKKQAVAALLRTYAGAASQHTPRTGLAQDQECQAYDDFSKGCWAEVASRNLDDTAETLLGLPAQLGGVGAQRSSPASGRTPPFLPLRPQLWKQWLRMLVLPQSPTLLRDYRCWRPSFKKPAVD